MFLTKTINYLVLTDLQGRRLDFGWEENIQQKITQRRLLKILYTIWHKQFKNIFKKFLNFK